ncbi:MAG: SPOR domain-containing protein [Bacteroidetes bacterium]|nr:SPOR domain-containing protein [Bacteroidota bacterium]
MTAQPEQQRPAPRPVTAAPAVKKQTPPGVTIKKPAPQNGTHRFSVQADTVDVTRKKKGTGTPPSASVSVKASTPMRFYTVEVGAFRLQSNVERHRRQLTERYKLPVRVLYDASIKLTRVCVGTFSSRALAASFMTTMQQQYPADYPDCWVSYWTK